MARSAQLLPSEQRRSASRAPPVLTIAYAAPEGSRPRAPLRPDDTGWCTALIRRSPGDRGLGSAVTGRGCTADSQAVQRCRPVCRDVRRTGVWRKAFPISTIETRIGDGSSARRRSSQHTAPRTCQGPSLSEVLAATILPLLHRPPCCVSFSGGLDSSIILATATDLALRQGLPLPIPVTLRFPGVASAMEDTWQELVISHLRLSDWVKLDFTSELDALGPIARPALRRFGILTPPNWYLHQPMIQAATGGSLLTGIGGDEIFRSRGELWWLVRRPPWCRLRGNWRGLLFTPFPKKCDWPSGRVEAAVGTHGCNPKHASG